jgi:hypothetical protein
MRAALCLVGLLAVGGGCAGPSTKAATDGGGRNPVSGATASAQSAVAPIGLARAAPPADVLPPLERAARGWLAGRRYGYRMTLGTSVSFGGSVATHFELSGKLGLTCIGSTADTTTLRVDIESPRVASASAAEQAELEQSLPDLAAPFFVTFKGGLVSEMRIAPGMKPRAVGTYRTLVAALQLARQSGSRQSWQARERDTTGEYLVDYSRDPHGAIRKQKVRYLSLLVPPGDRDKLPAGLLPEVVASRAELRASDDGRRTLAIELHEELAMRQLQAPMTATNHVSLQWVSEEPGESEDGARRQLAEARLLRVDEAYGDAANAEALDSARMGGMSFEAILAELEALARDTQRTPASDGENRAQEQERQVQRLVTALAATFRQKPETVEQALAKVRGGASSHGALLDALSASGSEASQLALIALLESPSADRDQRHAAAFALSRTPKPGVAATRALSAQLDDEYVGTQALYGIGTFCRLLREAGNMAASDELGQLLLRRLAAADGELAITRHLRAISNSGYAPALTQVRPFLDDDREAVQVDALEAVRLMDAPEVDGLIAARLRADVSVKAQLAALDAIKARKPTSALARALSGATESADKHVRHRAVELAGAWLERRPELRRTLERVARRDSEEKIRSLAASALRAH